MSHRHYSTGFWFGQPGQYYDDARYLRDWQVCAVVEQCTPDGRALLSLRNKFRAGDQVELVGPDCRPFAFDVPSMQTLRASRWRNRVIRRCVSGCSCRGKFHRSPSCGARWS